jgi:hypothetical protein
MPTVSQADLAQIRKAAQSSIDSGGFRTLTLEAAGTLIDLLDHIDALVAEVAALTEERDELLLTNERLFEGGTG